MKIRKSLMLAGLMGAGFVTAPSSAQVYVCMACAAGTYSDGTKTNCAPCPVGTYCPAGSTVPEICQSGTFTFDPKRPCRGADSFTLIDSEIKSISGSSNFSGELQPGVYMVLLGGGNGGDTNQSHCATPGGRGAILKYKFIVNTPTGYTLYSGGGGDSSYNDGGAGGGAGSAFKLDGVTYVAGGGGGEAGNFRGGGQGGGFGGGGGASGWKVGTFGGKGGDFGGIYGGGPAGCTNPFISICRNWTGNGGGEGGVGGDNASEKRSNNPYGGLGGGFTSSEDTHCSSDDTCNTTFYETSRWCPGNGKASHASNTDLGDNCNSCARLYKLR